MRIVKAAFFLLFFCIALPAGADDLSTRSPFRIGWIGALTGPSAKFGAGPAAQLAVDDINTAGGVLGRRLELIQDDAQGKGALAVTALHKLSSVDHVTFIVGGHGTPESAAIAPLAEQNKVFLLAVVTSSPRLTNISPNFARLTYVSTEATAITARYAHQTGARRIAMLLEDTDYVIPAAESFRKAFEDAGGKVSAFETHPSGTNDFRATIARLKQQRVDSLYVGSQTPDFALGVFTQQDQLGLKTRLFGNETSGNAVLSYPSAAAVFQGLIFTEYDVDTTSVKWKDFEARYKARSNSPTLPYGVGTAESYEAVQVLAHVINECGDALEAVKTCIRSLKDFHGVTGTISINHLGDGVRPMALKQVRADGTVERLAPFKQISSP